MMVVAILGGLLVFGCCGGAVVVGLGGGLVWVRSTPMHMQPPPPPIAVQVDPQVSKALDDLSKDLEPLKVAPDDSPDPKAQPAEESRSPESENPPSAPGLEEKKE